MQKASTYRGLMTVHFEAGGFAVAIVTVFGVPIIYLSCEMSYENDAVVKALDEVIFPVTKRMNDECDLGIWETFDVEFRGRLRLMTGKEWRESNTALSAPICWGTVKIDEVLSVREPIGWQRMVSNAVLMCLWLAAMGSCFFALEWCRTTATRLIYG
jgi:hypothetical protein